MIYLGQPYSDPNPAVMLRRYEQGLDAATFCIAHLGLPIYAPIVHSRPVMSLMKTLGHPELHFDFWRGYDFPILRRCEELRVLTLPGWETSVGLQAEIRAAKAVHMRITYLDYSDVSAWLAACLNRVANKED